MLRANTLGTNRGRVVVVVVVVGTQARFYLDLLLPVSVRKVIWLDSDTVALEDVAPLYDSALADRADRGDDDARQNVIAAVPRDRSQHGASHRFSSRIPDEGFECV